MKGFRHGGRRAELRALQTRWRWVKLRDPSIKGRRERRALNAAARRLSRKGLL